MILCWRKTNYDELRTYDYTPTGNVINGTTGGGAIYNYQNYFYSNTPVHVNRWNVAQNLMMHWDGTRYALHLVNHNYNYGIVPQQHFSVTVALNKVPKSVYMLSPDFNGKWHLSYSCSNNQLTINIDTLKYYDVVVIE